MMQRTGLGKRTLRTCCADMIQHGNTGWLTGAAPDVPQAVGPILRAEKWAPAPEGLLRFPIPR